MVQCRYGTACKNDKCTFSHGEGKETKPINRNNGAQRGNAKKPRYSRGKLNEKKNESNKDNTPLRKNQTKKPQPSPKKPLKEKGTNSPKKSNDTQNSPVDAKKNTGPKRCRLYKACAYYECNLKHERFVDLCPISHNINGEQKYLLCPHLHQQDNDRNYGKIRGIWFRKCVQSKVQNEETKAIDVVFKTLNNLMGTIIEKRRRINTEENKEIRKVLIGEHGELHEIKNSFCKSVLHFMGQLGNQRKKVCSILSRLSFRLRPFTIKSDGTKKFGVVLPALKKYDTLRNYYETNQVVVLSGQTGSGKSTQIPQYLADYSPKKILCTQPRKIAAISLADRVEFEYSPNIETPVKERKFRKVGYAVGGKRVDGSKIMFYTEQKLLGDLINEDNRKALLKKFSAIIIDEAHERSMTTDMILGILKQLVQDNEGLKVIVTSATINVQKFVDYFRPLNVVGIEIAGRTFPIEVSYEPPIGKESVLDKAITSALNYAQSSKPGHILVFLSAQSEVENCVSATTKLVEESGDENITVFELFGKQSPEQQRQIFENEKEGERRIIFATNVAETSLTIPGVRCVIDSGIEKESIFDHARNISVLQSQQISKGSAIQRAGRAGRTAPGTCIRLYSEESYHTMEEDRRPEILRSSLGTTYLVLCKQHISMESFPWIDQPPMEDIITTKKILDFLGAIYIRSSSDVAQITKLGEFIADRQLDPCMGKLLYQGTEMGEFFTAALLYGILSVDIWWYGGNAENKKKCVEKKESLLRELNIDCSRFGDVIGDYCVLFYWLKNTNNGKQSWKLNRWCYDHSLNSNSLHLALKTAREICRIEKLQLKLPTEIGYDTLSVLMASAFFQNICTKARKPRLYTCVTQGTEASLHPSSRCGDHEYVIYQSLLRTSRTWLIRNTPITMELLKKTLNGDMYSRLLEHLKSVKRISVVIPVSYIVIDKICGKKYRNVPILEKQLNAMLDVDKDANEITAWCLEVDKHAVERALNNLKNQYLSEISEEVEEVSVVGKTRAIYGKGGEVQRVLLDGEFVSVFLSKLPKEISEEALLRHINMCTRKRFTKHDFYSFSLFPAVSGYRTAQIMCTDTKDALLIEDRVNTTQIGDSSSDTICCSRIGCANTSSIQLENSLLAIRWPVGKNTGTGSITFQTMEAANLALQNYKNIGQISKMGIQLSLPLGNKDILNLDHTAYVKLPFVVRGKETKIRYKVILTNIPDECSEGILRYLFGRFGVVVHCVINRQYPQTLEQHDENIIMLKSRAFDSNKLITNDIFPEDNWKLAGMNSEVSVEKGLQILRDVFTGRERFYGQPAQIDITCGYNVSFNLTLYHTLQSEFNYCEERARKAGIVVNSKILEQTDEICFRLEVIVGHPEEAYLVERLAEIKELFRIKLKPERYKHEHSIYLFTVKGTKLLFSLGKEAKKSKGQQAYIHWNKKNKTVLLYGKEHAVNAVKRRLDIYLDQYKRSEEFHFFYRKDQASSVALKFGQACRGIDEILRSYLQRKFFQIVVHCEEKNLKAVKKKLSKKLSISLSDKPYGDISERPESTNYCITCYEEEGVFALQGCGHKYDQPCIQRKVVIQELNHNQFPIKCDDPGCGTLVCWRDIVSFANPEDVRSLVYESFKRYIRDRGNQYVSCFGPNCTQIFDRNSDIFNCDICSEIYCARCCIENKEAIKIHPGMTCEQMKKVNQLDYEALGMKLCPKCGEAVEKNGGCMHMSCICGAHFCWVCSALKTNNYCGNMYCASLDCSYIYHHMGGHHSF